MAGTSAACAKCLWRTSRQTNFSMKTNSFADLSALKNSTDLVAVVQARGIKLTKQGSDFVGLCPFHKEETPSFRVSPSKNLFHCFGCGAAGSVIDFVMKKDGLTKQQAIEVALCHGWIDGQLRPYDEQFWLIRFTPRSSKSRWSEINRTTAAKLMAEGRMAPSGHAQVEAARLDGRWESAYAPQSKAIVPADLRAALDANPTAKQFFAKLTGANRYAVLYRIQDARTVKTRGERIQKFVEMLERHEVVHPVPVKRSPETEPGAEQK